MITLNYKIVIKAPKQKVWDIMLSDETYREWTEAFSLGSYFKGNWEQGSEIEFLAPGPDGKEGGMYSRIAESRPYDFVSVEHLGEINDGLKKPWTLGENIFENYTFVDHNGETELLIEMTGIPNEYQETFEDMWPKALEKLKGIVEG